MKKILAIALAAVMTVAVLAVAVNAAAEPALLITAEQIAAEGNQKSAGVASVELKTDDGTYAQITSAGDDPWVMLKPVPTTDVANKYAAIKYRSTSEATLGIEVYTEIAEPHATTSEAFQNDGQWHTIVIDLSTAQAQWKGNFSRLDPMNAAGLPAGEVIDIAWIALFASEDDAKAYTGPAGSSEQPSDPQPVEKGEDQWLCGTDPENSHNTGWWFNPVGEPDERYFTVSFKANGSFDGIKGFYLCSPDNGDYGPTSMKVELIKDGATVAEKEIPVDGDKFYETDFGKVFGAGDYSLKYSVLSGAGEGKSWFVIGSFAGSGDVTIDHNVATNDDTLSHPVIMLKGATGAEPSNPGTADASVIAIAAVACVALAGVVIAKKVR